MRTLIGTVVALVMLGGCSPDAEPSPPPTPTGPVTTSPTPADTVTSTGPTPTSATTTSATTTEPPDSTTETSSPEATGAPTLPPEATEDTEAGAEAFALYYMDLVNYAYTHPEAGLLEPLSAGSCEMCSMFEGDVTEFAAKNQRFSKEPWIVTGTRGSGLGPGAAAMTVLADQTDIQILESDGSSSYQHEPLTGLALQFSLTFDEGWQIDDLRIGEAP